MAGKSKYNSLIKLGLIVFAFAFLNIPDTKAWFSNTEISRGNSFGSGTLEVALESFSTDFDPKTNLKRGDTSTRTFKVKNTGTVGFVYDLEFDQIGTDTNYLCEEADLKVSKGTEVVYDGALSEFSLYPMPTLSLNKESEQEFSFEIKIPLSSEHYIGEQTCNFNVVAKAWIDGYIFGETAWWDSDSLENSISTKEWDHFSKGEVVINEVFWSGSTGHELDKWIELRNTTGEKIDLTGWTIAEAGAGPHSVVLSGEIPANGYYLISQFRTDYHKNDNNYAAIEEDHIGSDLVIGLNEGGEPQRILQLKQNGEKLSLKSPDGVLIDETPEPTTGRDHGWAAGERNVSGGSKSYKSMQRVGDSGDGVTTENPGDGADSSNWVTCTHDECDDETYWENDNGNDYGTPKRPNLYVVPVLASGAEENTGDDDPAVLGLSLSATTEKETLLEGEPEGIVEEATMEKEGEEESGEETPPSDTPEDMEENKNTEEEPITDEETPSETSAVIEEEDPSEAESEEPANEENGDTSNE